MHILTYIYIHTTYIHMYIRRTYIHIYIYIYIYVHTYVHEYIHPDIHATCMVTFVRGSYVFAHDDVVFNFDAR